MLQLLLLLLLLALSLSAHGHVEGGENGVVIEKKMMTSSPKLCFLVPPWQCARHEIKWAKYHYAISAAVSTYQECSSPCFTPVQHSDLHPWKGGITPEIMKVGKTSYNRLIHYQIISGKLYRSKECMFTTRCQGVEHFLLEILRGRWRNPGAPLKDMEFVVNVSDYPQVPKNSRNPPPVFSFSKNHQYMDIMYPAWTFWEGGPALRTIEQTGLGRWDLKMTSLGESSRRWPWNRKKKVAFFRGSRTSAERDPLIYLARSHPNLFNATYMKNQAWKSEADTLGPPATEISLEDHCQFRYLYNFRGVAASFRLKHLFLCRSLVFHVGDDWLEFFYPMLKPWVHYIPVPVDLKNALELAEFSLANDHVVHEIAERGYEFIVKHLKLDDVTRYWYDLMTAYGELLTYTPTLDPNLVEIVDKKPKGRR